MKKIHVGVGTLNQCALDWKRNLNNIFNSIEFAASRGIDLLLLPELCVTGYGCEDQFHSRGVCRRAWNCLKRIAPNTTGMVVIVGLPVLHCRGIYNCAAVLADGKIHGFVAKQHLAGDGVHYEPRWLKAWKAGEVSEVRDPESGAAYPIGDIVFEIDGARIGLEICEDAWVANRPGRELARRSVDIICNPSASHFSFGKHATRRGFVLEGSRAFNCVYLYTNLLGNESGRTVYDGDSMIAAGGEMLSEAPLFPFTMFEVSSAIVDIDRMLTNAARTASFQPAAIADQGTVTVPFKFGPVRGTSNPATPAAWQSSGNRDAVKFEEFSRAVALGFLDYLDKSGMQGATVSLSGGADSCATAVLVRDAVHFADQEVDVRRRLPRVRFPAGLVKAEDFVGHLLMTAYQGSDNSSSATAESAQMLAAGINARHRVWNISPLVDGIEKIAAEAIGRKLNWEDDDITLQNIQARVRAPGIWAVANIFHHLLLTTSNRSEADVGYATMDGDTAGSFNLIGGVDKEFIREWLRWREEIGPNGLGPLPALSFCNSLQPSAELRPTAQSQSDEKDLMPYPVLHAIEVLAIQDKLEPVEIYEEICASFRRYDVPLIGAWVKRFFVMWARNQWKRERYAPCLHLDSMNTDPRSWCRFPIISGSFTEELADLERHLRKQA